MLCFPTDPSRTLATPKTYHAASTAKRPGGRVVFGWFLCAVWMMWAPLTSAETSESESGRAPGTIRVATYNVSLYGRRQGEIRRRLEDGSDPQAERIARIVQRVRPDILLLNEIDFDAAGTAANLLATKFLAVAQVGDRAIEYPHRISLASNTGLDSGLDLDSDGKLGEPEDAWGFGHYPGQYAMAVLSRFPIDEQTIRTFQQFRWCQLPDASMPIDPDTGRPYYPNSVWRQLRLSSKTHADVPILIAPGRTLHLLISHPTPPVFDGPEDRNGCRNRDEIRFWLDYLRGTDAKHLVDDQGRSGGVKEGAEVIVMGDLNADAHRGDGDRNVIANLLQHPQLRDPRQRRRGAGDKGASAGDDPALGTASFSDDAPMRLDYVLPSRSLHVRESGVHWPRSGDGGEDAESASDHRLVWVELELSPPVGDQ